MQDGVYDYSASVTPRKPSDRSPGRQPYDDPSTVRSVVRSTRFTAAEDGLVVAAAGTQGVAAWMHDVVVRAAKRHKPSQRPTDAPPSTDTSTGS